MQEEKTRSSQDLCEYYFDSHVERVSGDESAVSVPRLYFERDLTLNELPYRLFAVFDEWLPSSDSAEAFDTVKIWYKRGATNCTDVRRIKENMCTYSRESENVTKGNERNVVRDGNVLLIAESLNLNPSGAGCIEAYKGDVCVAKFYFAINFLYRQKIFYTVDVILNRKVTLKFRCKSKIAPGVSVGMRLLGDPSRLPCLKEDRDGSLLEKFTAKFNKKGVASVTFDLTAHPNITEAKGGAKLFVVLEEEYETAFVLEAEENETIPSKKQPAPLRASYTCPFCHGPISVALAKCKSYRTGGGALCSAQGEGNALGILDENGSLKRNCLMCKKDRDEESSKIFPDKFLEHANFKVAFDGASRAGKTTYISRFFGLKSKFNPNGTYSDYNPSMQEMQCTLGSFGILATPATIKRVEKWGVALKCKPGRWEEKELQYTSRGMEIGREMSSTDKGDYTPYPFMTEVNNKSYVSFYDIAGEDAEKSASYIEKIAKYDERTIGIFFIVTATSKDKEANDKVSEKLMSIGEMIDPKCPVAVILTKMDAIGDRFDSSCACRRFDYYPLGSTGRNFIYSGSYLEKYINHSSEEIKSFIEKEYAINLERKGHKEKSKDESKFENVKYFCVSSFGFEESIYHNDGTIDGESYVQFSTSSRRMELPFIWMMKQFGIIK